MIDTTKVYIIGAGPGDPSLITLKALDRIQFADVILYDRLVNPMILNYNLNNALKINVGKKPDDSSISQQEIIDLIIYYAKQNKIVVRLKGGDPLIFGRGSEEALALENESISYEIISGISAAIGASSYNGIPLTHRNIASQCIFVTAHESDEKLKKQVDWNLIANLRNTTIVIYMGCANLYPIIKKLLLFGLDPDTPAAVVCNATLPYQKTIFSTVAKLVDEVDKSSITNPMITIIGYTINIANELKSIRNKPLFGKRIVTTRAYDQSSYLFEVLNNERAWILPFYTFRTEKIEIKEDLKLLFKKNTFDWIIFTSENGVRYFYDNLYKQKLDSRVFCNTKIAAIGSTTASILKQNGIIPNFIPSHFTSKALFNELFEFENLSKKSILRIMGDYENDYLINTLKTHKADITKLTVYKQIKEHTSTELINNIKSDGADAYLFTSSSTVKLFYEIMGQFSADKLLKDSKVIAIGPVTNEELNKHNIHNVYTAQKHTINGVIEILKRLFK